jgi:hypothetical protein
MSLGLKTNETKDCIPLHHKDKKRGSLISIEDHRKERFVQIQSKNEYPNYI